MTETRLMTETRTYDRGAAIAFLRDTIDVARESGDALGVVQEKFGVSVVDAAELLWDAFVLSGATAERGSIVSKLEDSDSPPSFAYAKPFPYEPDDEAPRLPSDIGTVKIGAREIPRLGLGCMRLVSKGGVVGDQPATAIGIPHSPESNRHALLTAFDICGIRYFDASRGYGPWPAAGERLLREWLSDRADAVVASKVGYLREPTGGWVVNLEPEYIAREIEGSARSFGGKIPVLYLVVRSTPTTPIVNRPTSLLRSLEPLLKAKEAGVIENIGIANVTIDDVKELESAPIAVVQNRFSLDCLRDAKERAVLDWCASRSIPFVAWGLFGEGLKPKPAPPKVIIDAARDTHAPEEELMIAALLASAPHVVALPGPGRRSTIYSCVRGASRHVDADVLRGLA